MGALEPTIAYATGVVYSGRGGGSNLFAVGLKCAEQGTDFGSAAERREIFVSSLLAVGLNTLEWFRSALRQEPPLASHRGGLLGSS